MASKRRLVTLPPEAVKRRCSEPYESSGGDDGCASASATSGEGRPQPRDALEVEGAFPDISTREVLSAYGGEGLAAAGGRLLSGLRAAASPMRAACVADHLPCEDMPLLDGSDEELAAQLQALAGAGDLLRLDTVEAAILGAVHPSMAILSEAAAAASPAVFPSTASCAAAEGRSAAEQEDADEAAAASAPTFEGGVVLEEAYDAEMLSCLEQAAIFEGGEVERALADVYEGEFASCMEQVQESDTFQGAVEGHTGCADLAALAEPAVPQEDGEAPTCASAFQALQQAFQRAFAPEDGAGLPEFGGGGSDGQAAVDDRLPFPEMPADSISELVPSEAQMDDMPGDPLSEVLALDEEQCKALDPLQRPDSGAFMPPPLGGRVRSTPPRAAILDLGRHEVAEGSCPFHTEDDEAEDRSARNPEIDSYDSMSMPPPTASPQSPPSPPPTPMHGKFLIREGSDRGDVLKCFVTGRSFQSTYEVGRKIGEGGFGKVFVARHRVLGVSRAVKRLGKTHGRAESHKNELQALLALDHPHIVKLVEYFDEESYLYLIFELCHGPDLFDRVTSEAKGRMSEIDASVALRHMLKAIQCCHAKYRGHFDIKPENFMYESRALCNLKMIDLGMSSGFDLHRRRHKIKGTAAYMAPELWRGTYGPEADIWSCGVVLFVMLTGEPVLPSLAPATMKSEPRVNDLLARRMRYATSTFKLSPKALDLLAMMLQHDRHGRPTVQEALKHPFCNMSYENEHNMPHRVEQPIVAEAKRILMTLPVTFRLVSEEPMLMRVARLVMAHVGDPTRPEALAFRMLDWHGYGELSLSVLEKDLRLREAEIPENLDQLFESMDLLREGYMSYLTFLSVTLPAEARKNENMCRTAFRVFDRDMDGFIDTSDLTSVFGNEQVCRGILQEVSAEECLSWEAFRNLMREAL